MPKPFGIVYGVARAIASIPFVLLSRRKWEGEENLPAEGGFLVVANHVTELDAMTFMHFITGNGYPVRILAKDALFRVPVLGWLLRKTKQVPVYRKSAHAADSLAAAIQAVNDGECVGIFPEGTLTRDPNMWPMVGKTGAARIALATGVPVIPVAQWGAHLIKAPYGGHWKPFPLKTVLVRAGKPVDLSAYYGKQDDHEAVARATELIMQAITDELQVLRPDETPPPIPWDIKRDGDPNKAKRLPDGRAKRWWRKKPADNLPGKPAELPHSEGAVGDTPAAGPAGPNVGE